MDEQTYEREMTRALRNAKRAARWAVAGAIVQGVAALLLVASLVGRHVG